MYFYSNGTVIRGNFAKGIIKGSGKVTFTDGSVLVTEFTDSSNSNPGPYRKKDGTETECYLQNKVLVCVKQDPAAEPKTEQ